MTIFARIVLWFKRKVLRIKPPALPPEQKPKPMLEIIHSNVLPPNEAPKTLENILIDEISRTKVLPYNRHQRRAMKAMAGKKNP